MKKTIFILFALLVCLRTMAQTPVQKFDNYPQTIPASDYKFTMLPIKAGVFMMGSKAMEAGRKTDEGPQKKVAIAAFWMAETEVTRDEFDVYYRDATTSQNADLDAVTRPSAQYIDFSQGMGKEGGFPATSMSQYGALMYCRWLYNKTGIFYRLPSEAEWEYACKAGTTTAFYFGDDSTQLDKYAWYKNNSNNKFQKVKQKLPNAWGLYDMLGNVAEWTLDHYDEKMLDNLKDATTNPFASPNKAKYPKSLRGGAYKDIAADERCAARIKSEPLWNRRDPQIPRSKWWITDAPFVGFRIIRPMEQPSKEAIEEFFKSYLGK